MGPAEATLSGKQTRFPKISRKDKFLSEKKKKNERRSNGVPLRTVMYLVRVMLLGNLSVF